MGESRGRAHRAAWCVNRCAVMAALCVGATPACSDAAFEAPASASNGSAEGPGSEGERPDGFAPAPPLLLEPGLSDPDASPVTRALFSNLRAFAVDGGGSVASRRVLFGQQEADTSNRTTNALVKVQSDVESVAGKLPGLVSYEVYSAYPSSTSLFDVDGLKRGLPALKALIIDKYELGIVPSLVWHMRCPKSSPAIVDTFGPKDCPDYTLDEMLDTTSKGAKGKYADAFRAINDVMADFIASLTDSNGDAIPVLYRPMHEFTGDWFWWGRTNKPEAFQAVWRAMVTRFRERGAHNVLWVFCPDKPTDDYQVREGGDFEKYYPGDAFVDVVGFDRYDTNDGAFAAGYAADLRKVGGFARDRHKVAAVTEVGLDFSRVGVGAQPTWFTAALLEPLVTTAEGRAFSYVALWRNAPWEKYMVETNDGALTDDFRRMAARPDVLFADAARGIFAPKLRAPGAS